MTDRRRRRERVGGTAGPSEPGTVEARWPAPPNILPEPPPQRSRAPRPPVGADGSARDSGAGKASERGRRREGPSSRVVPRGLRLVPAGTREGGGWRRTAPLTT